MERPNLSGGRGLLLACAVLLVALVFYYGRFIIGQVYLWEDLLFYSYPSANFFARALEEGRFPLWICGMHNGLPFYTNLNLTAFYPPLWLLALVAPGGKVSFTAYQCYLVLQLLGAGIFAYLFLRDVGMRFGSAVAGMIVFVFSAFMSLHIIHVNVITSFMWLPLQCLFVNRIAGHQFRPWSYLGLIVAILMSFLAGFPQVVMYNSYCVTAYWIFLHLLRGGCKSGSGVIRRTSGLCLEGMKIAGVFLAVILLGAMQFYAVAENWLLSTREQYSYAQITDESLPWHYLIHAFIPNFFGASNGSGQGIPFWGFDKSSLGYATFHAGAWQYWEFGFFAGQVAMVALFVLFFNHRSLWKERREFVFFLWSLPLILLLMMGCHGGLFRVFYHVVPGFSIFRAPARIGCLLDFCLAVNVALLVDMMLRNRSLLSLKKPFIVLGVTWGVLVTALLVFGSSVFPELANPVLWGYAARQIGLSLVFCAIVMAMLGFMNRTRNDRHVSWLLAGVVAITFLELSLAFKPFHQGRQNPDDYYADRNGLIGQMAKMREATGPFRFAQLRDGKLSEEVIFPRNIGYFHPGYEALEGYVLFNLKDWSAFNSITNEQVRLDVQNVGVIANADTRARQVGLIRYTNSLPRVKFYQSVRTYDDPAVMRADLASGRLDYRRELGVMKEDCVKHGIATALPATGAQPDIRYTSVNPDEYRISYQVPTPGVILVSESFYPGWVTDAGRYPIIRAFGAFKGIVIPEAGNGVITIRFEPTALRVGLLVSGVTAVLLAVWASVVGRRWRGPGKMRCGPNG